MTEDFLHFVWKHKQFDTLEVKTTKNESVEIKDFGVSNIHGGPDFLNARVKINHMEWAGHVEIHLKPKNWFEHKHHEDENYKNVILHVVYEDDNSELDIPTIELKNLISSRIVNEYNELIKKKQSWIPCQNQIKTVKSYFPLYKDSLLIERLENKENKIKEIFNQVNADFEKTLWIIMAKTFGGKANAKNFEDLFMKLDFNLISKINDGSKKIEAYIFGMASMIKKDALSSAYELELINEFQFLKTKYNLKVSPILWNYGKVRPFAFPDFKLAQLIELIKRKVQLFQVVFKENELSELKKQFQVKISSFWNHYSGFNIPLKKKIERKGISKSQIDLLLINGIIPFIFFSKKQLKSEFYSDVILNWMSLISPEKNHIISKWKELGFEIFNASDTQALIQLKNTYCSHKKCLNCKFGFKLLKN